MFFVFALLMSLFVPFKHLIQVVEAADVILQVLDARDPIGCRSIHVESAVLASSSKKLVLVLNKIDLVPVEVRVRACEHG